MIFQSDKKIAFGLFILISIAYFLSALLSNTLGEGGDSTTHYLFARLSWQNPKYFFDHWAKPLFTILLSPFAQFGIKGAMVFNVICTLLAAWLSNLTARELNLSKWYWTGVLVLATPLIFPVTLSGLTEPLSALLLILAVYYFILNKHTFSVILASFLPFVRSEGLLVLAVFAFLLLLKKKYKILPWLVFGHLFFSILGWFHYRDFLWVFNKIPYATMGSVYGQGNWSHFVNQLYFCLGPFVFAGFCLGAAFEIRKWISQGRKINADELILIYGIPVVFIFAHSAFWALGIFNSMGLNRVLVTVFPLCVIIAVQGFSEVCNRIKSPWKVVWQSIFLAGVIGFPFLDNPASTKFTETLRIKKEHVFFRDVLAPYLKSHFPQGRYFAAEPEFALFTGRDILSVNTDVWINPAMKIPYPQITRGDVLIFDSLVMGNEHHLTPADIRAHSQLKQDTLFLFTNDHNKQVAVYLFVGQ